MQDKDGAELLVEFLNTLTEVVEPLKQVKRAVARIERKVDRIDQEQQEGKKNWRDLENFLKSLLRD